jgi:hypothetical protein
LCLSYRDEERSTLESPWRWPVAVAIRKRLLSSEEYHQMLGAGICGASSVFWCRPSART